MREELILFSLINFEFSQNSAINQAISLESEICQELTLDSIIELQED
jgi:hypothetical protein